MNGVGHKATVVSLADAGDDHAAHGHPKVGLLGNVELAVVHQLVEPITVYSTLFGSKKVMDGAHDLLVPLTVGVPNLESSVKVVSQL